jgi:predicted ATP-grasp superfamily ATP-dependent carboligase
MMQELGRRGVEVYALDSFRNIGTVSRYSDYLSCPHPGSAENEFVDFLMEKGSEFDNKPVLIPTNDHWAAAVAHHKERLSEKYHPCVADGETVDLVTNKDEFGEWASENGYPVPQSWDVSEVDRIPENAYPIAAKPSDATGIHDMTFKSKLVVAYQKLFGDDSINKNDKSKTEKAKQLSETRLRVFNSHSELQNFLNKYDDMASEFVFQEYVRGMSSQMYTVGIYANQGDLKGIFTGRKVRGFPPDVGDCKVGQVEDVPEHLVSTAVEICDDLGYHGIAEFEYKQDSETREYKLIEINPRSWSWIGITPSCGVSLPWLAYADHKEIDISEKKQSVPSESVKWVKITEDFPNCIVGYRALGYNQWSLSLGEYYKSIQANKTVYPDFAKDDPLPTAYSLLLLLRRGVIGAKRSIL